MLRISHIRPLENFTILCTFNNGITKSIDIMPLLEKHKHLQGIEKLKEKNVFLKARIGMFGEILWDKLIVINDSKEDVMWDYDISPEFVFYNGVNA